MTEKNTYWVRADGGDYALITGAEQRDRWAGLGWADADEPTGGEFVWARHEGIAEPARFAADALTAVWAQKGWYAAEPPSPVSPFNGDEGAPVIPVTPAAAPLTAGSEPPTESSPQPEGADSKPAARRAGTVKE